MVTAVMLLERISQRSARERRDEPTDATDIIAAMTADDQQP